MQDDCHWPRPITRSQIDADNSVSRDLTSILIRYNDILPVLLRELSNPAATRHAINTLARTGVAQKIDQLRIRLSTLLRVIRNEELDSTSGGGLHISFWYENYSRVYQLLQLQLILEADYLRSIQCVTEAPDIYVLPCHLIALSDQMFSIKRSLQTYRPKELSLNENVDECVRCYTSAWSPNAGDAPVTSSSPDYTTADVTGWG
jgi:hypothetical protein